MPAHRTVVLEHQTASGAHFDWMIARRPGGAIAARAGRLTTFRVMVHPRHWLAAGRLTLTPLADHRSAYLDDQGPVSGGRGWVRRVARGSAMASRWTGEGLSLQIEGFGASLAIDARRVGPNVWLAACSSAGGSCYHEPVGPWNTSCFQAKPQLGRLTCH